MPEYTREQLWKLYEKLPPDLREAIFSGETADHIHEASIRNGLEENKISELATKIGNVLLGLLPPGEFQAAIEKDLGLEKILAKRITQEINRFIFFPVKQSLAEIYKIGLEEAPLPAAAETAPSTETAGEATMPKPPGKKAGIGADTYRESVE